MTENEKKTSKENPPKGGRKGGTTFPRLNIEDALGYSKRLVSKTFSNPQPEATILVGVFDNKGPVGSVRASALRQYGLMDDDAKGHSATDLAKRIDTVVPEERSALVRESFLRAKVFKQMLDALQGERVTRAKVRQVASSSGVHPDNLEDCVEHFIEGASYAGLGVKADDGIDFTQAAALPAPIQVDADPGVQQEEISEKKEPADEKDSLPEAAETPNQGGGDAQPGKPVITVSLNVDPSSDPDKLEKQLKLLRQFKLI